MMHVASIGQWNLHTSLASPCMTKAHVVDFHYSLFIIYFERQIVTTFRLSNRFYFINIYRQRDCIAWPRLLAQVSRNLKYHPA